MKIGLILPSLVATKRYHNSIFAPKELVLLLADGLVKKGHQVFVYTSPSIRTTANLISFSSYLEDRDFLSCRDLNKPLGNTFSAIRMFNEYEVRVLTKALEHANKEKLDILHDYLGYGGLYFVGLAQMPMVFTLHDPVFPENTLEYQRIKQFPNHNYIAISHSQKDEHIRKIGIRCNEVIYHGLQLENFTFSASSRENMIFYGRFIKEKGVTFAIQASQLTGRILQLASSKIFHQSKYYKKKIKPHIDSKQIIEVDFLDFSARNKFLGQAKVALFPIQWEEPFGMTLIESMACGTPVVAFARGSVPEIVKDGETGFIVNSSEEDKRGDWIIKKTGIKGLTEAVNKIYSMSKEEYQIMRCACRAHIEANFTVEKMVEGYERVYQQIISQQKK